MFVSFLSFSLTDRNKTAWLAWLLVEEVQTICELLTANTWSKPLQSKSVSLKVIHTEKMNLLKFALTNRTISQHHCQMIKSTSSNLNWEKHRKNCNVSLLYKYKYKCVHSKHIWESLIYFYSFSIYSLHCPVVPDRQFCWLLTGSLQIQPVSWNYTLNFPQVSHLWSLDYLSSIAQTKNTPLSKTRIVFNKKTGHTTGVSHINVLTSHVLTVNWPLHFLFPLFSCACSSSITLSCPFPWLCSSL